MPQADIPSEADSVELKIIDCVEILHITGKDFVKVSCNTELPSSIVAYLASHPYCAECERQGRHTLATEVDHIKPHKGNLKLFWDRKNWQGLCHSCHSVKTAKEDGSFGNKSKS